MVTSAAGSYLSLSRTLIITLVSSSVETLSSSNLKAPVLTVLLTSWRSDPSGPLASTCAMFSTKPLLKSMLVTVCEAVYIHSSPTSSKLSEFRSPDCSVRFSALSSVIVILFIVVFPELVRVIVYSITSPTFAKFETEAALDISIAVFWSNWVSVASSVVFPSVSSPLSETSVTSSVPLGLSPLEVAELDAKPASICAWVMVWLAVTVAASPGARVNIGLPAILPASALASVISISVMVTFPVFVTTMSYSITSPTWLPATLIVFTASITGFWLRVVVVISLVVFPSVSSPLSETSLTSSVPDGLSPVATAELATNPASMSAWVMV